MDASKMAAEGWRMLEDTDCEWTCRFLLDIRVHCSPEAHCTVEAAQRQRLYVHEWQVASDCGCPKPARSLM